MVSPSAVRAGPGPRARFVSSQLLTVFGEVGLILVALVVGMQVGDLALSRTDVLSALLDRDSVAYGSVVWEIRLPRVLIGVACGVALGTAGALIQALTRNPLADPGVLGVNAGASLALVLAAAVFGVTGVASGIWFALAGAAAATTAVHLIGSAGSASPDPGRLLLAGVAISAFLGGATTALVHRDPDLFAQMSSWGAGSFERRRWEPLEGVAPYLALGMAVAVVAAAGLKQLALGDALAAATGLSVTRARLFLIVAITLLAASATALAGPIGFVGLMVPHLARPLARGDERLAVLHSALLGVLLVLVLVADILGQVALPRGNLPVGIVTGLIGAPVLIWLVRRTRSGRS